LGLPEEGFLLVSVGSLIESKGHHLLIGAVAELARSSRNSACISSVMESTAQGSKSWCVKRNCKTEFFSSEPDQNEELNLWFSAANLSCLLSSREGWPNVVSEALACGTPVLATRTGGIPEIISSPELGMFVERNVQSIAVGLERALAKSWNRAEIARRSRSRSWDTVAAEVEAFFESTIQHQLEQTRNSFEGDRRNGFDRHGRAIFHNGRKTE